MKIVLAKGWCIEVGGNIINGQDDMPALWNDSEKEIAKEFMDGEYPKTYDKKLVKIEIRRVSNRR